jgi:hypothetical protein
VQYRVRRDRIDKTGTVTQRYRSRLRHIRVGAAHRNKPVHTSWLVLKSAS